MNGNDILTCGVLIVFVYGFYNGWRQLTTGTGLICGHIPIILLNWINKKSIISVITKVFISLTLAYLFAAITIIKLIIGFLKIMFS